MPEMNREEIAKLEALYASNPEGRVFTHLAEAYRKAGDFDRARKILEQGLSKHPGYASAYVVLGRVQLDLGQSEEAEASFRRVLDLDPHNLVALRSLGDLARAAGDRDQALAYFEELRHQDPGNDEVEGFITELRLAAPSPEPAPEPAAAEAAEPTPDDDQGDREEAPEAQVRPVEAEAPAPEAEPADVSETAPEVEVLFIEEQEQELEIIAALEDFPMPERDYGDLVSPDIELNWEAGEQPAEAESGLPGDLADFAGMNEAFDIRDEGAEAEPEPPPPEEVPEINFPDVGEPADIDAELAEAEADEAAAAGAGVVVTETMAQLYRDQGLYERAADVYRQLLNDRPFDAELARSLAEVEALASIIGSDQTAPEEPFEEAAPEPTETEAQLEPFALTEALEPESPEEPEQLTEEPEAAPAFDLIAPEAAEPPAPADFEEVESPWTAPHGAVAETPNPYTWTEEQPEADAGQPIQAYFRELLAWRPSRTTTAPDTATTGTFAAPTSFESQAAEEPSEPEPEVANFAAAPELAEQPAILDLTMPAEPPAIPADAIMPWEEPASPSMPAAAGPPPAPAPPMSPPPSAAGSKDPVEAAFDEWFSAVDPAPAPPSSAPPAEPSAPAQTAAGESPEGDDDDDLEMFRSWLQSLKK
jgi:tetratricopeptide (TPR) repeat protein